MPQFFFEKFGVRGITRTGAVLAHGSAWRDRASRGYGIKSFAERFQGAKFYDAEFVDKQF